MIKYPSISEVVAFAERVNAIPVKDWKAECERIRRRDIRYAAAIAAGREPGRNGRPITSNKPRAEYFREWKRRKAHEVRNMQ